MIAAATALESWCDATLAKLQPPIGNEQALGLAATLRKMLGEDKTLADPEAAMALLWAYKALTEGSATAWKDVQAVLPLGPQDLADRKGSQPTTAGMLLPERLRRFNEFAADRFKKLTLPPHPAAQSR